MINRLQITNCDDAESYSFSKHNIEYDIWISTVGREDQKKINRMRKNFKEKNIKFFYQYFADWSDEDSVVWKHLENDAPQHRHVQNIISFIKPFAQDNEPHHIGINCHAGISRSTSIGIIALVMSGRTIKEALAEILKDRPVAWPNLRILKFASDILGIDVYSHVNDWKIGCISSHEIFILPNREQKLNV